MSSRSDLEAKLARRMGRSFSEQERRILAAIDENPDLIGQEGFWEDEAREFPWLQTLLVAAVISVALDAVHNAGASTNVMGGLVPSIEDNVKMYSLDLVKGITDQTRATVTEALDRSFAGEIDRKEMERIIGQAFSPARAQAIATTETTRAFSEGQLEAGRELQALGFTPVYTFHTSQQDVCDECIALDDKEVDEDQFPPLHPNCQCWVTASYDENKTVKIVKAVVLREPELPPGEIIPDPISPEKATQDPEQIYSTDEMDWGVYLTDRQALNLRLDKLQSELEELRRMVVSP